MLRIGIHTAPDHVCVEKEHHRDLFREAFVGITLPAEEDPEDPNIYLVEIKVALLGLMERHGPISIEGIYWQMRWKGHRLSDHVRFPKACCDIIR